MEDKLFDLLGLGVSFYLAAATYTVFSWLDSNASDDATKVISSWLHGRSQHKPDLGNLIINAFDRIYTSPLLTFRAFRRSAVISTIIWLLVYFIPWLVGAILAWDNLMAKSALGHFFHTVGFLYTIFLCITILIDYTSLLFVRRFLVLARIYPISASLTSSIVGIIVVIVSFICVLVAIFWLEPIFVENSTHTFTLYAALVVFGMEKSILLQWFFWIMRPAFIIHLWLPLFVLSSLAIRLIYLLFRAVEWAQWFLKQGDAHPLKAIGVVATIIVFGSAMLVKEGWALLGVLERS
jgi:hypothetical protein